MKYLHGFKNWLDKFMEEVQRNLYLKHFRHKFYKDISGEA